MATSESGDQRKQPETSFFAQDNLLSRLPELMRYAGLCEHRYRDRDGNEVSYSLPLEESFEPQDFVQQALADYQAGLFQFNGPPHLTCAFLKAVIHNRMRRHYRDQKKKKVVDLDTALIADARNSPLRTSELSELRDRIDVAMAELPPRMRLCCHLHWLRDLPMAEVASIVGISIKTAREHCYQGKKRVRHKLAELGRDYGQQSL
jgi:RNA polymerase sigma factor (sigma-70 family)